MNHQPETTVGELNRLAAASLLFGVISILPYLPALTALLLRAISGSDALLETVTAIPVTVYALAGILFGTISITVGRQAHEQLRKSNNVEKGHGMATAGRILGIFGVILNLFFGLLFVLLLKMTV